jgi:hypothetical protein
LRAYIRAVGRREQPLEITAVGGEAGDADGRVQQRLGLTELQRRGEGGLDALSRLVGGVLLGGEVGQDDDELVAAGARDQVALAHAAAQARRNLAQHRSRDQPSRSSGSAAIARSWSMGLIVVAVTESSSP